MTEAEWLSSVDANPMVVQLRHNLNNSTGPVAGRKMRLFASAWYRCITPHQLHHEEWASMVERGEDPPRSDWDWRDWVLRPHAQASSQAADMLRDIFGNPFRSLGLPKARFMVPVGPFQIDGYTIDREFGPDYCPWFTQTVIDVAQMIYDERAFERMPELGDALETAGCTDVSILNHCRGELEWPPPKVSREEVRDWLNRLGTRDAYDPPPLPKKPGPHFRGCWVLDRILGKE